MKSDKSFLESAVLAVLAASLTTASCSSMPRKPASVDETDPHLWLEEIESEAALDWAKSHNEKTLSTLSAHPKYKELEPELRRILTAKDRLPAPKLEGDRVYNFWQDQDHKKGYWRRTSVAEYQKPDPKWETLLDIDALSKAENESWVWKGANCLAPEAKHCFILLSRGGKDAVVVREFNLESGKFVEGGYELAEAKSDIAWIDQNTVFVGTDFGNGSMTASGYPRQVKVWKRGEPLSSAKLVFEAAEQDMSASGVAIHRPEGTTLFISRQINFYEEELFHFDLKTMKSTRVPFPKSAQFQGFFNGAILARLRKEWKAEQATFAEGSLIALPLSAITAKAFASKIERVFTPDPRSSFSAAWVVKNAVYLDVLDNVKGRVLRAKRSGTKWKLDKLPLPDHGTTNVLSMDPYQDRLFVEFESFLLPTSYFFVSSKPQMNAKIVKQLPSRFDANGIEVEQLTVASKDGEKIPYFVIRPKNAPRDGSNPTLLYGYGGFEIAMTPYYLGAGGKVWLEKGGVFVLANIRGGGEFGPRWHQAALLENRQKAFDDFIAIAEDLIRRGITSPQKLAIEGGSNGGLLVGAVLTQRPELFRAVICEVPLLDMLRYHKLLAGQSWMAEYGDPEDPKMRAIIRAYSPYQNIKREALYPRAYFTTSTRDDRVHPGHARKMVARLEELGHDVMYFENTEGGHGNAADLEQRIRRATLKFTYLFERLVN